MSGPVLSVEGLDAYYESAHVLHGVSFEMAEETVAVVGRNGMGKTTLCTAIMGLMPSLRGSVRGSIRFLGKELVGRPPEAIAAAGIGYVPQGRRLFPSLSVDEHLRMLNGRGRGVWGAKQVYELFPQLAERRRHGGAELSGGEQQMLAIGRALLTNPKLLIMDEPSAGLSPLFVSQVIEVLGRFRSTGLSLLIAEQNVAFLDLADRVFTLENGRVGFEGTVAALHADDALHRAYFGLG
jgi:branched-chain amino acid transport system ATP-binding protein